MICFPVTVLYCNLIFRVYLNLLYNCNSLFPLYHISHYISFIYDIFHHILSIFYYLSCIIRYANRFCMRPFLTSACLSQESYLCFADQNHHSFCKSGASLKLFSRFPPSPISSIMYFRSSQEIPTGPAYAIISASFFRFLPFASHAKAPCFSARQMSLSPP